MADKKITRQLFIFINGKQIKNSLGGIGRKIGEIKGKLREANDPADIKKYKAELEKLRGKYAEVKEEVHGTNNALEEAKGHFSNMLTGFLSGDIKQATSGLKGLLGNLKNITKAAWAFIKTPIGIALAVLSTVGVGVKNWVEYNLEIEKTNQLIRDLTQETGNAVDTIRIRAEVLKKTFDVDINQSVATAKSLAKSFGISYNEAFNLIEEGAVRGKLTNNEYLDSLKEYPVQFKNAGFSAKEFNNIVSTGIDLSIYTDKLPDAIKEFSISVKYPTKAVKEALTDAFGPKFTNKLLTGVRTGAIKVKDAFALVSKEAKRIGLNAGQAQKLSSDLFRGAGEDAGGALKIFEAVNIALNEQKKPLTDIQQIQKDQLEVNKELNGVYTQLFASGSRGFNMWIQKGKLFASQTLLKILKGGVDIYNWFVELNNESGAFSAILSGLGKIAMRSFDVIGVLVSTAWESFKGLGNVVAGVFTGDWARIKKGFTQGTDHLVNAIKNLKDKAVKDAGEIYDALNGKNKLKKLSLKDFVSDDAPTTSSETPTGNNSADSDTLEAQKKLQQKKRELFEKGESELDTLIKEIQEKRLLNSKKGIEKELLGIDQKYAKLEEKFVLSEADKTNLTLAQIEERENQIAELEAQKALEKQDLKKIREAEFREELKAIEEENRLLDEEAKFDRDAEAAATDEERQLILLAKAKYIADQELLISKAKELEKVKDYENAEILKEAIRKKYDKKQEKVDAVFEKGKQDLKKEEVKWTELTEEQKFGLIKQGLGQAADAFNKGSAGWKAMKISEAIMSTYEGAQNAFTSLAKIPFIGVPLGIAAAAAAVKSGINRVAQIKNTPKAKIEKGFYQGGFTGNNPIRHDGQDGVAFDTPNGPYHINEWVAPKAMTESPRYAPTINWLEKERKNNLKTGFFDGGHTASDASTIVDIPESLEESNTNNSTLLLTQITRLNNLLDKGILSYALIGDDKIQDLKAREEKLNNTRENAKIQ